MSNKSSSGTEAPLVSIIIVNWNGLKWLAPCLDSLRAQTLKNFETILVDNASTDDSQAFIKQNYPEVTLVVAPSNLGFAGGNNLGLGAARGTYILLLNNDTITEPDYLENFVKAFDEIPHLGAAQSKMVVLDHPDQLDSCGSYWTATTFLYHVGHSKPESLPMYNQPMPVFCNKGASMMIRRDLIDKLGLFDDDFWCYYEETDLCHRLWLAGYECWYWPKAKMAHAGGGTSLRFNNATIQFHNAKNKLLSYLKNYQARSLFTIVPTYLVVSTGLSLLWLAQGRVAHFTSFYKALWWNVVHFSETRRKRQHIQSLRVKSDREIAKRTTRNPRWQYYLGEITGKGLETYVDEL